ncbi:MAG: potassium channel family protein [Fibrobacterota bacterium]
MSVQKKLIITLAVLLLVIGTGTAGYSFIMGWPLLDCLYMTVITITTVGLNEVSPLSSAGKMFTIALIFSSVGIVAFALSTIASVIMEGQLKRMFWRRNMEKKVSALSGHYILCGYGRIGKTLAESLFRHGIPFVIIEKDSEIFDEIIEKDLTGILGDALDDKALIEAGIMNARGVLPVLPSDADNVFITLSAKQINQNAEVIAWATMESSRRKLEQAGAKKVYSPYVLGGNKIALSILRPHAMDFLDYLTGSVQDNLHIGEVEVGSDSSLIGKSILEKNISKDYGIIIIGIKRVDGSMVFNPPAYTRFNEGDILIVLGELPNIEKLEVKGV